MAEMKGLVASAVDAGVRAVLDDPLAYAVQIKESLRRIEARIAAMPDEDERRLAADLLLASYAAWHNLCRVLGSEAFLSFSVAVSAAKESPALLAQIADDVPTVGGAIQRLIRAVRIGVQWEIEDPPAES